MLSTVASLVTGAMLISAPIVDEPIHSQDRFSPIYELAEGGSTVSYTVSVNSTTEELEDIRTAAEEAGMAFTYKKRGVKTRLVIDMIIETADDYTMERIVIKEEDGKKKIQWEVDDKGQAIAFISDSTTDLTEHSK